MIEKLTILEVLLAGFFGIACFWAPTRRSASDARWLAKLAHFSVRLEGLRRSRWQWLTMLATMLSLRMQNLLPPAVEVTVGIMFAVMLAPPVLQMVRVRK